MGLYPKKEKIFAKELPIIVDLKCPIPNGLAIFGEDISIIIFLFFPDFDEPNFSPSFEILFNKDSASLFLLMKKFMYGPLGSIFSKNSDFMFLENCCAISIGFFFNFFNKIKSKRLINAS